MLHDMSEEVAEYVDTMVEDGKSYSVGYNTEYEAIEIEAKLTDEQIANLVHKFDILKITNEELNIIPANG